jgi:hypothetical protein
MKLLITTAMFVLLSGCQRHQPVFIINHRDHAVQVIYRFETFYPPEKRNLSCRYNEYPPRLFRGTDVSEAVPPKLESMEVAYDAAACEIHLTLPAKSSVYIDANDTCSGDTAEFGRTDILPTFKFLRIESATGSVQYSGWEVARVLEEHRGWLTDGDCRLEIR